MCFTHFVIPSVLSLMNLINLFVTFSNYITSDEFQDRIIFIYDFLKPVFYVLDICDRLQYNTFPLKKGSYREYRSRDFPDNYTVMGLEG